jgi:hypothetical protein
MAAVVLRTSTIVASPGAPGDPARPGGRWACSLQAHSFARFHRGHPFADQEDPVPQIAILAADWVAIGVLVFALYIPRHRRRDLVVAFLVVNTGVLAVSAVLADTAIAAGVGLGLFGVLSIIRLRSTELEQHEVAYYFSALALGLLAGLSPTPGWITLCLMTMIVAVVFLGDHPKLFRRYRHQQIVLDRAWPDETALIAHLEQTLGARVHRIVGQRLDLVNDTTTVEVRYQLRADRVSPVPGAQQALVNR